MPAVERVAIVGMAALLPGAGPDLGAFWANVAAAADCSDIVPEGRWLLPPEVCGDARIPYPDSVYSTRGYYLDPFEPDVDGLSVPPDLLAQLDPLFHLALDVGHRAWKSAKTSAVDRRKVGVVLGNICLPTDRASDLAREYLGGKLADTLGAPREPRQTHPLNRYVAGLPAGLLAKALGLGGGTFTLDAACASSLYAVKLACDALIAGRADAVLAGGMNRSDSLYTQMGFSQLRALSPSGRCSPFDSRADGLMVGEGAVILVLKRLSDALRQSDTILGVVCGAGLSNDMNGNLLAPAKEGQLRAMRAAYAEAGWKPHHADVIECHATGTPVGDAIEFDSLRELWGDDGWQPGRCTIGSVKSTVGHLLTGAGGAAVAKVLLGFAHKTRPPQANFETPGEGLKYEGGPFRIPRVAEPWDPRRPTLPRRAAVSGFGFGGVNAHLLIEEYVGQTFTNAGSGSHPVTMTVRTLPKLTTAAVKKTDPRSGVVASPTSEPAPAAVAVVGVAAHFGPWDTTRKFQEYVLGGGSRPDPTPKRNGWGLADEPCPPGYLIEGLTAPLDRFRIPPREIEEMLPQQLLMLTVATAALDDCTATAISGDDPRSGVYIGLGLDPNTTNFHVRWAAKKRAADADLDAVGPPLTADRTMGALGSIAASRIARTFRFGGPSFTVCSEESSGARAIELAVRALRANELDRAVVGGVDLTGDPRTVLAAGTQRPARAVADPLTTEDGALPGEGAAAVVLKRLADAERDGDRVYAVIRGVGCASGGPADGVAPDAATYASSLIRACSEALTDPASVEYLEAAATGADTDDRPEAEAIAALLSATERPVPLSVTAVRGQVGAIGAAGGVAGLVKACLALRHRVLPPTVRGDAPRPELAAVSARCQWSGEPRYWLADTAAPRRALVAATGADGSAVHVLLEEYAGKPTAIEAQPLGARPEAVFALVGESPSVLVEGLDTLTRWLAFRKDRPIEYLAREWFRQTPPNPKAKRAVTFVARSGVELLEQITHARDAMRARPEAPLPDPAQPDARPAVRDRVFYSPNPLGPKGKVAFVYPGSGNQFPGMGRDLGAAWPAILDRQQTENTLLRTQYASDRFWGAAIPADTTAKQFLFGQVALGTLASDILVSLGVRADAMVGQSLGESAGLFGLRVWRSRDEMLRRLQVSPLFGPDLGPPYDAARRFWMPPATETIDWVSGVLAVSADDVRAALRPGLKAYLLIVTTPTECVVGGLRADVEKLVGRFGAPFFPLAGVTLAHCEVAKPVEAPYRELHTLPTTPPPGLTVYSGAYGRPYRQISPTIAADSITAGVLATINFPAVVNAAYHDGVRFFLEPGPGNSAARMVTATLGDKPHVARAVCAPRQDGVSLVLRAIAHLIAERGPADLASLYGGKSACAAHQEPPVSKSVVAVPVGMPPRAVSPVLASPPPLAEPESDLEIPITPGPPCIEGTGDADIPTEEIDLVPDLLGVMDLPPPLSRPITPGPSLPAAGSVLYAAETLVSAPPSPHPMFAGSVWAAGLMPFVAAAAQTQSAAAEAHDTFLRVQDQNTRVTAEALGVQSNLVSRLLGYADDDLEDVAPSVPQLPLAPSGEREQGWVRGASQSWSSAPSPASGEMPRGERVPRALDTEQCFEFARGRVGDVLGAIFAEVDSFPTRVRLPDGPLMLVDRIHRIEGEPKSLTRGRVVTEHQVRADRWYLDAGRIPTCVAVEAGQADLFLSGFLGIDFHTRGLAVYRLLDAVVTFHRGLPAIGDVITYDIHIDEFFHQSDTWLFRFRFEATVNGERLMSMSNGVAGFFTAEALASGRGIVHTRLDLRPMTGKRPDDWRDLVPQSPGSLTAAEVTALREGDLVGAFGPDFARVKLHRSARLPGGMLRLLDRVSGYDADGGRFGMGFVRAEYDVHPDDWFLTCHFVDDMVMPGTLMYECCLHTLRVLLTRLGWVGEEGTVACEPVPGVSSRLKCRGQVIATTKLVAYEVSVKELGYGPEPYCIADALMYADGKPIVEITDMTLRMSGLSREKLEAIWDRAEPCPPGADRGLPGPRYETKPALYDSSRILAFSNGNPSDAFGEPYRVFDQDRVIARLPGPPFQFLDRVTAVTGDPFVLKSGVSCEAQYDVPPEAWYFAANRTETMPFSVLLEVALQPCGWLAAYCGSALTSDADLSFRNLGGQATQHLSIPRDIGTLTVNVTMTGVSNSAGMIIQHYTMTVSNRGRVVYEGTTYFGFFGKHALANQVGMPQAKVPYLTAATRAITEMGTLPSDPPFPDQMMRMVDRIDGYLPTGGRAGLGLVQGSVTVDPSFWFFQAHFYQDPVWPGSLGLESFLQLLKFAAWKRWGGPEPGGWQTVALGRPHEWTYRGQVVPTDSTVTVVLEVTAIDDYARRMTADGFLTVDGRVIYQMKDFTLE